MISEILRKNCMAMKRQEMRYSNFPAIAKDCKRRLKYELQENRVELRIRRADSRADVLQLMHCAGEMTQMRGVHF